MGSVSRVVLLAAAIAVTAGTAAQARPAASGLRVACPQKAFVVAFYPKGEKSRRAPHVKVYTRSASMALVLPTRISFGPVCKAGHDARKAWDGSRAKTTTKRVVLTCRVAKTAELTGAPYTGRSGRYEGNDLFATLGRTSRVFLRARIGKGASLRYDPRYCKKR